MKWLQDNPVGVMLASVSGFFVLLALVMAVVWNLSVSVSPGGEANDLAAANEANLTVRPVGDLGEYDVINEKPVFNESRLPDIGEAEEEVAVDETIAIKDAPAVKLTGVVITPESRFASLTPEDSSIETVMAREGEALTGEFVGWRLASVSPRVVVLESRDGQSMELELQVHDVKIAEPPPVAPASLSAPALSGGDVEAGSGDEEPMSRAEQIRQRIAERREELRREQEAQQAEGGVQSRASSQPAKPDYQSAIRALMNKSKDQGSNEKEDG